MTTISLDKYFGIAALSCVGMGLQCMTLPGVAGISRLRKEYFSEEFMKANFNDEHQKEFGTDIQSTGYPDTGCGRYASKLSYGQWFRFNRAQRAHMNLVESIGFQIPLVLLSAIDNGLVAAGLGWGLIVGRYAYTFGYLSDKMGPKGRIFGGIMVGLCNLGLFIFSIKACVGMIKQAFK